MDFIHSIKEGWQWRVRIADSIEELIEVFHLRYQVYLSSGYLTSEELCSGDSYDYLTTELRHKCNPAYENKYEVDRFDRLDEYANNDYCPNNIRTKHILALRLSEKGPLRLDGMNYTLEGYMRVILDDYGTCDDPIGFTPDTSIDLKFFRDKVNTPSGIPYEGGRLVKQEGTDSSIISGLTRAMVNCTFYGEVHSPDMLMSVRPELEKYYKSMGAKRISKVFMNHELKEEHVLLHVDLTKARKRLDFTNRPLVKPAIRIFYPKLKIDRAHYSMKRLN